MELHRALPSHLQDAGRPWWPARQTAVTCQHLSSRRGSGFISPVRAQERVGADHDAQSIPIGQPGPALNICSMYLVDIHSLRSDRNRGLQERRPQMSVCLPPTREVDSAVFLRPGAQLGQGRQRNWALCSPRDRDPRAGRVGICADLCLLERVFQES